MRTPEEIIFGRKGSANSIVKARLARAIGKNRSTVILWSKDVGKIPLKDFGHIVRVREMTDKQIVEVVRSLK